MGRGPKPFVLAAALAVLVACAVLADPAAANTFSNTASIGLRDPNTGVSPTCSGGNCATAATYPSTIPVSGLSGTVTGVTLSLNNVSYAFSDDIDALLVGPGNQSLIVVAAVGPNGGAAEAADHSTLTISDAGTLPTAGPLPGIPFTPWGSAPTFKPVNFGSFGLGNSLNGFNEDFVSPAPPAWGDPGQHGTNATLASIFNGTSPNGTWSLYVITTSAGDGIGAIADGWTLNITTAAAAAPTTTTLSSSNNPSFTASPGNSTTLTATVHKTSDNSNVNEGTVAFTDGGVTIPGCGAVSVSAGTASCTNSFTTEGTHAIAATYSGTSNFGTSSNSVSQVVNNHTTVTGSNFCNTGSIALNNPTTPPADATPYPSDLFVSGLSGTVNHVTVTLSGVTYSHSQDIDALLVGPGGQTLILVANLGPNSTGAAVSNGTLTFSDAGVLPPSGMATQWSALSTIKPVNYGGFNETWGPPAPLGPYGDPGTAGTGATLASKFNGINGNGTWSLYVITTGAGDGAGAIGGGWCANITAAAAAGTTTTVTSNNNPSFTSAPGNSVTLTATVTKTSDSSNVSEGTVAFTDGGAPIGGCGAVSVSAGTATCTTTFGVEGNHQILAQYSGTANFGPSSDSLTQVVNDHTTVTGNSYCNTGSIALNNPPQTVADATPYPSDVFVTGRPGALQHLTVTLKNTTYGHSQDIDALLVGPGGQTFILVAAAGPNTSGAISNVTLTLDDNAASTLAQTAIWGAPGATVTSKPVNYGGQNEAWGPPAPTGPYGNPGPSGGGTATLGGTFNGASPNGTWSLYLITTAAGDGTGSVANGWCLGVTSPAPPTLTKSFGAASIPQGGSTSLSFTVTNPNAVSSLTGVGFTDTLPAGLAVATPNGLTGTCGSVGAIAAAATATSISFSGATLAAGASCTFSVNVTASSAGAKVNTTSAPTSTEGGSGTAATATLGVVAPPSLAKSFVPATVPLNGSTSLILTLTNPNATVSLSGVGYTDTLPAGLVVATDNVLSQNCILPGAISAVPGSSLVSLSGATLAANASCTISLAVTGTSAGAKVNTTSAVSSNEGGNGAPATATLNVNAGAVQIVKAFGAASVPVGGSTSLGFTVSNATANGPETGIAFTDTLPAGLVVATPNGLSGSCGPGTITAAAGATSVSLSGASLAAGAACTFNVNVTGTSAGVKNNSVTVASTEGGTGNTSNASLTVVAPPSLAKSFVPATVPLNGSTILILTLTNPNATVSLSGVGYTDTLPAGLIVATDKMLSQNCILPGAISAVPGSSLVSLSGATLAPNASCTISLAVTGTSAGAKVNTTSVVSSNEGGNGAPATATLNVNAGAVQIVKAFGAASVPVGGSTSLGFTVSNATANGPETGIAFTDTLPAGLVVATPNGLSGSCGPGTITAAAGATSVSLSGASLAAGAACTFNVNVTGTSAGVKNNSVTVASTEGGTGNTSNASLTVVAPPSLAKSFVPASVPLNGSTGLILTLTNPNATVSLSGVGYTDTLPAGVIVATDNMLSQNCILPGAISAVPGSSLVSLSGATLAPNASCTISLAVTGTSAGAKVNTTSVVSSTEGGSGAAATATLTVLAPPVIAKAFAPSSIPLNGTSTLTFTLTNPNPADELDGVAFTDTFPAGLVVASPSGATSTCANFNGTANPGSGGVSANTILLPAGGSCTFAVNVTGTTSGAKNNSVTVTSTNGGTGNTATASLNVAGAVQIVKSFGAATVPLGGSTSLSFTVSNPAGNGTETGIAFTDTLPAGVVVATPNGLGGTCSPGTITAAAGATAVGLSGATLADGASCTFAVNVTGTSAGVKNNSVTVSSTEGGPGNTSNASLTVVAPPTLMKAFGAASVPLGGTTSLRFTAGNPNATTSLTGVGFTDTLPAGLTVATPNGLSGSCGVGTITAAAGSGSVSLSGATLLASGSCTFSVNVTGASAGAKVNTTSAVSSTEGGSGAAATATLTVLAPPVIAKAFAPSSIPLNGTSTLTFTLTNPNPADELDGVAFTDTFPAGLVVASPAGLTTTCNSSVVAMPGRVNATVFVLPAGASCTVAVNVTGTTNGPKNNSVTVTSTNGGTGNTATATLQVAGAPQITKSFGAATIPVGGSTSLSFTVTNPAGNGMATGVGFNDLLPAGVAVSTPNGLSGSCDGGTIAAAPNATAVGLTGATLADGAPCTFSVNVTGTSAGVKINSVTVSSTEGGTGNTSNAQLTVVSPPTLMKAFGAATIPLNGTTSLTFTASNPNATTGLTGVGFSDPLPAGLAVATPTGLTGSCGGTITATPGATSVSLSGAMLGASSSCTFSVNVTGVTAGPQSNTTSVVSSNEGGSGAAATATLTVLAPPVIAKAFAPSAIPLNGTSTLTLTLTNPNPSDPLNGVAFTDNFPAGLSVATPSNATSTCANLNGSITPGGVSATGILLPPGVSCTFTVDVTATTVGVKNNSVTVMSTDGGTGNTATASLTTAMPPQIAKAFGAATIPQGGQTSLGFTITNPAGNIGLTGVAFTDTLPAGMTVATPNGLSGGCGVGTITATAGSGTVSLAGAGLAPGAVCTFAVNVTSATVGAANNSVSVTASESGPGNTANTSLTVVAPPTITKAFGAATIPLGGQTSLSFTVGNPAGNLPLTGVGFTDGLPTGLAVAATPGVTGGCGGMITATAGSPTIVLSGAMLTAGATCTFSVNVTGTAAGLQKNSVTASSDNGGSSTKADASVNVVAPPTIVKSFGSPTIPFGTSTSLSFTVTNPNAATPLSGVGFTDTLPAGLIVATPNGLTGTCGPGTITAAAGSTAIGLSGATLLAGASCTFAVNVTATAVGPQHNTTSTVSSNEGGSGAPATADVTVGKAPTTTTVTATPPSVAFGSPVTFTATVAPAQSNGSGTTPTGTVSFFVDGSSTAAATVALSGGQAAYTVSGLGAGSHTVVAVYNGDQNFLGSTSSPGTPVAVTCATTVTGTRAGTFIPGAGATCIAASAHLTGGVIIHAGSAVDFEGAQIDGSIDASAGPSAFRLCGSTVGGALLVAGATGFVLVGDPGDDACPSNTIRGSLSLKNNTHGLDAIGNHVAGSITITGNSGAGPFAQDTGPEISGNGP